MAAAIPPSLPVPTPPPGLANRSPARRRAPPPPSSARRRRDPRADEEGARRYGVERRQSYGAGGGPDQEGYPSCDNVGNEVLSCFPNGTTSITQGDYSKFIWNRNYPTFIGVGSVDIYLFSADTERELGRWTGVPNERGTQAIQASEDWWSPTDSSWGPWANVAPDEWESTTRNWPLYFVIVPNGQALTGGETHQSTFTAVQTAPLSSLVSQSTASFASTSAAASATSAASLSSASILSSESVASLSSESRFSEAATTSFLTTTDPSGRTFTTGIRSTPTSLQSDDGDSSFPGWAIAVIVVLGVLALIGLAGAAYLIMRKIRKDREAALAEAEADGSVGSRSPMMAEYPGGGGGGGLAPSSAAAAGAGGAAAGFAASGALARQRSGTPHHDGASAISHRPPSQGTHTTDGGPISSVEAMAMADAFRQALRKPEFPPAEEDSDGSTPPEGQTQPSPGILGRELMDEGLESRSVTGRRRAEIVDGDDE